MEPAPEEARVPRELAAAIDGVGRRAWVRWSRTCAWCARTVACAGDPYLCAHITGEWDRLPEQDVGPVGRTRQEDEERPTP